MKLSLLFVAAAMSLVSIHTAQACDIDAARMAIQSAQSNAEDAASADELEDAQSSADGAANSAKIYLSDCNT